MIKKIFLIILLLLSSITIYSSVPDWNKIDYKDDNMTLYYQYKENGNIYFSIKTKQDSEYKIEMYDIFGRKLFNKTIEFSTVFNKSNISKGIYCLRIHNQKYVINKVILVE
jgi:hypothetical protein